MIFETRENKIAPLLVPACRQRWENLNKTDIIYSVITRLELTKLQTEIEKIDPNAFIVMNSVKDLKGGMIKKRKFKEK